MLTVISQEINRYFAKRRYQHFHPFFFVLGRRKTRTTMNWDIIVTVNFMILYLLNLYQSNSLNKMSH